MGANVLPPGIDIKTIIANDLTLGKVIVHSERNTITKAIRQNLDIARYATLITTWFPCRHCAELIAMCGIRTLVCTHPDLTHPKWGAEFRAAELILQGSRVGIEYHD